MSNLFNGKWFIKNQDGKEVLTFEFNTDLLFIAIKGKIKEILNKKDIKIKELNIKYITEELCRKLSNNFGVITVLAYLDSPYNFKDAVIQVPLEKAINSSLEDILLEEYSKSFKDKFSQKTISKYLIKDDFPFYKLYVFTENIFKELRYDLKENVIIAAAEELLKEFGSSTLELYFNPNSFIICNEVKLTNSAKEIIYKFIKDYSE